MITREEQSYLLQTFRANPDSCQRAQRTFEKQHNRRFRRGRHAQEHADFHNPDKSQGLLCESIIAAKLCYPDPTTGELIYKQPTVNGWVGFDFIRPYVLDESKIDDSKPKTEVTQEREGSLHGAPLDEVRGHDAEQLTAARLYDPMNVMHILTRFSYGMLDLQAVGLVRLTTYAEAYERVSRYDDCAAGLAQRGLIDEPVYQVTPKGNGLVFLMPPSDTDDASSQLDRDFAFRQA